MAELLVVLWVALTAPEKAWLKVGRWAAKKAL